MTQFHRRVPYGVVAALTGLALAIPMVLTTMNPLTAQAVPACTQTITGYNNGVVNVAGNQKMCMINAIQNGAVNVAPGGGLSVTSSTIIGAVTLKSGFTDFEFCGSTTVRGAISATGGAGTVLVGGSGLLGAVSCPANTIDGAVTLNANLAGVQLARSFVGGAVTASANLGGTTISANRIGGSLTCTTNAPAPTNAGASNAVAGGRSGQTCSVSNF